jgi:hypothetical protein
MKIKFLSILLITSFFVNGQDLNTPIITSGDSINSFIPENCRVIQIIEGDLNKDKINDVAIVFQDTNPSKIELIKSGETIIDTLDSNQRTLLVLIKDSLTNKYILKGQTNSFIIHRYSSFMNEPFQKISIKNNTLILDFFLWYSWGSWSQTELQYIFRYQNDKITLVGAEYNEVHRGTSAGVQRSFNFLTKKMCETKSELDTNGEIRTKKPEWTNFMIKELKTLETLSKPLDWIPINGIQL